MKKLIFILSALLVAAAAHAQVGFGIKAGPNFASNTSKAGDAKTTTDLIVGIIGGVYARMPLAQSLNLQPALLYEGKGGTTQNSYGDKYKTRLNYLTLPIDVLFMPEMPGGNGAWMIGLGPYFAYGFSSKSSGGPNATQDWNTDVFKDGSLNRFDAGVNVLLGFEMASGLNISAMANLGLVNIAAHGNHDNYTRNTSFGIALGYTFKTPGP